MSEKPRIPKPRNYVPGITAVEVHEDEPLPMSMERMMQSFQVVFGIPRGCISTEFKNHVHAVLTKNYPRLNCSIPRAIIEGRFPGIPKPIATLHTRWKRQTVMALRLFDLMATMARLEQEEKIEKASPVIKRTLSSAKDRRRPKELVPTKG